MADTITVRDFGVDNFTQKPVKLYSLHSDDGKLIAEVMTYGATLLSLYAPGDKTDASHDVVVGYDHLSPYFGDTPYYGATVGRVCNRIEKGHFKLNNQEYQLAINNGPNHLHGGIRGFNRRVWDAEIVKKKNGESCVKMSYLSPDGEENYPGTMLVTVTFSVGKKGARNEAAYSLVIEYVARLAEGETKSSIVNLTNHAYFNLAGNGPETELEATPHYNIHNHRLAIRSSHYLPSSKDDIPTGEFRSCKDDPPMDFQKDYFKKCSDAIKCNDNVLAIVNSYGAENFGRRFGDDIDNDTCQQIVFGKGYDHNWMLSKEAGRPFTTASNDPHVKEDPLLAAIATCAIDDHYRYLAVYTSEPGLQLYTGNWLGGDMGKTNPEKDEKGNKIPHLLNRKGPGFPVRRGFALETQHYPDTPNKPQFPTIVIKPGEIFESTTIYEVGTFILKESSKF